MTKLDMCIRPSLCISPDPLDPPPALSGELCPLHLSPKVNQNQFLTPLVILTSPRLRAGSGMTQHVYYYKSYYPGLEALDPPT